MYYQHWHVRFANDSPSTLLPYSPTPPCVPLPLPLSFYKEVEEEEVWVGPLPPSTWADPASSIVVVDVYGSAPVWPVD